MADIVCSNSGNFLAVVCNTGVRVLDFRDGSCMFSYTVPIENQQNSESTQEDSTMLGHSVLCCFSRTGSFFALCTPQKELLLWRTNDWTLLNKRELVRRTTVVLFTHKEDFIITANKGGDVYRFSVSDVEQEKEPLLGHVSIILDMVLTRDDKYLITAERDEKIRVSNYPNSYNIHSFCLGHLDFVSCLSLLSGSQTVLVSGGGDGTVRFWNAEEGKQIACKWIENEISQHEQQNSKQDSDLPLVVSCLTCCQKNSVVCALAERSRTLHLYLVNRQKVATLPTLEAHAPPWRATFDREGRLWCVQPHPEEAVMVFEARGESTTLEYKKISSDYSAVLASASDWSFLKGCLDREQKLETLRKREVDNLSDYLARKEERLQRKKKKEAVNETSASQNTPLESEAKRPRLEA